MQDRASFIEGVGQPVLIPGSMGTASWVLVGAPRAMEETFGSVCHGAGRLLSRTAAKKGRAVGMVREQLSERGVYVRSETRDGILEEIPEAYKDVDEVVEVVHRAGLARKAARLYEVTFAPPERVVGRSTTEALMSGLFYGTVGQIDSVIERILKETKFQKATVVATGGLAQKVAKHSVYIKEIEPNLTLLGLQIISELNFD